MTGPATSRLLPIDAQAFRLRFWGRLRAYFLTGLVVSAPIGITIWLTLWFIGLFDVWIKPLIPYPYNPDHYLPFSVPGVGLVFALVGITLIGALAANLVGRRVISYWDALARPHPDRSLGLQGHQADIRDDLLADGSDAFGRSDSSNGRARASIRSCSCRAKSTARRSVSRLGGAMYAVYISTTPNPTSGYVYFVDVADVRIHRHAGRGRSEAHHLDGTRLPRARRRASTPSPPNVDQIREDIAGGEDAQAHQPAQDRHRKFHR